MPRADALDHLGSLLYAVASTPPGQRSRAMDEAEREPEPWRDVYGDALSDWPPRGFRLLRTPLP